MGAGAGSAILPTMRQLLLLRHGKAGTPAGGGDFERPLATRGRRDAKSLAGWLRAHGLEPDLIVTSSAARAQETAVCIANHLEQDSDGLAGNERLYLASPETILSFVGNFSDTAHRVLLVGHNPGLAMLVSALGEQPVSLPTATLAVLEFEGTWAGLSPGAARLAHLVRPADITPSAP